MKLEELQGHVRNLACLEETDAPVVSCYLNLDRGKSNALNTLNCRVGMLGKSLGGKKRQQFEEATARIEEFLRTEPFTRTRGVAIFSRVGERPFFLPLQFQVPVPNWIAVNSTPNIYHLTELKDTYHRYVILISTEEKARILTVNLGGVTEELWMKRPELRKRVGREWSKEHYQNHRRDRAGRFFKEKIRVLEKLMSSGGHTHLILAGNPQNISRLRKALPRHLSEKLVDTVSASGNENISDVVAATLSSFIAWEEEESLAIVDKLNQEINTHGLAASGTEVCFRALRDNQADVLVLAKAYDPEPGWICANCGKIDFQQEKTVVCPACGAKDIGKFDIKEEMVRMAERNGCSVEVVEHSDVLMLLGGVGCLLRYLTPEQHGV